jgi:hypothetical protein
MVFRLFVTHLMSLTSIATAHCEASGSQDYTQLWGGQLSSKHGNDNPNIDTGLVAETATPRVLLEMSSKLDRDKL